MNDWPPLHDYSRSQAVVIGSWDYDYLTPIPAAENSMRRMVEVLTGSLCDWPTSRLLTLPNGSDPGDVADQLIAVFENIRDVALFYYVGHGQIDSDEQLCLGLKKSRPEPLRRSATSLKFDDVRKALLASSAATKIVILDCCFAGLANRPTSTLEGAAGTIIDKTSGTGAYTIAATSAFTTAWYESDQRVAQPQTFFTKYFIDLIEKGIPGQPSTLRLDTLYKQLRDNLMVDKRPSPQNRIIDSARDFVFAYNAAPPQTHRDPELEIAQLSQLLAESESRRVAAESRMAEAYAHVEALHAEAVKRADELARGQEKEAAETRQATRAIHLQAAGAAPELEARDAAAKPRVSDDNVKMPDMGKSSLRPVNLGSGAARRPLQSVKSPTQRSVKVRYRYVQRYRWILTVITAAIFLALPYGQMRLTWHGHWPWIYGELITFIALLFALPLLTNRRNGKLDISGHQRVVHSWQPARYPSVDVLIPVVSESIEVLRHSWVCIIKMSEYYQGNVTPYVLDDMHRPELKEMAHEFGFAYGARPNPGWFKKSGSLWFGYQVSYSEFVLVLDADCAPDRDFLNETLPYMDAYPDIGVVRTAQVLRHSDDETWVNRGADAVDKLFYRYFPAAQARDGYSIGGGNCTLYRRAALQQNLGITLADDFEDVLTVVDLNNLGWKLHYLPVVLSSRNCPEKIPDLLNEQYRRCSGTVKWLTSKRFRASRMSIYTRLGYVSWFFYYIYTTIFAFVVPALTIMTLIFFPNLLLFKNTILIVPLLLYFVAINPWLHHSLSRLDAWGASLVAAWAHFFAYWDTARGGKLAWPPFFSPQKNGRRRFWSCFLVWSAGSSVACCCLALWRMMTMVPYDSILPLALGCFELMVVVRVLIQPAASV